MTASVRIKAFTSSAGYFFSKKPLAKLADGTLLFMWHDDVALGSDIVTYYSEDDGATWTDTTDNITLNDSNPVSGFPQCGNIFVDTNDVIWAIYRDVGDDPTIIRGTFSGGSISWGTPYEFNGTSNVGTMDLAVVEIGSDDYIGLIFYDRVTDDHKFMVLKYTTSFSVHRTAVSVHGIGDRGSHIDFHHTGDGMTIEGGSPHFYISYCNASALYYRRIAHSSTATWSIGSERIIDSNIADKEGDMYFDGDQIVMVQPILSPEPYYAIWERDEADTTSTSLESGAPGMTTGGRRMACWYDADKNVHFSVRGATPESGTATHRWAFRNRSADSWESVKLEPLDPDTDYDALTHIAALNQAGSTAYLIHGDFSIDSDLYFNSVMEGGVTAALYSFGVIPL